MLFVVWCWSISPISPRHASLVRGQIYLPISFRFSFPRLPPAPPTTCILVRCSKRLFSISLGDGNVLPDTQVNCIKHAWCRFQLRQYSQHVTIGYRLSDKLSYSNNTNWLVMLTNCTIISNCYWTTIKQNKYRTCPIDKYLPTGKNIFA